MIVKALIYPSASVCAFGFVLGMAQPFWAVPRASAQAPPTNYPGSEPAAEVLLPLEDKAFGIESQGLGLDAVADDINGWVVADRDRSAGLGLEDLPLVGDLVSELVDEEGNVDFGMDLPVSIGLDNVMGETGLVLGADFAVD